MNYFSFIYGGDRGWNSWISSLTQWTWVWANSRRQGRTRKLGVLPSIGSKRVGHRWATEQQCLKSSFPHPLLFLKDVFIRYKLLSNRFFSLSTLKMLLNCISCIFFSTRNILSSLYFFLSIYLISLAALKYFFLTCLRHLITVNLGVVFLFLGFSKFLESVVFIRF